MSGLIEIRVSVDQINPEVTKSKLLGKILRISVQDINEKLKFEDVINNTNLLNSKNY